MHKGWPKLNLRCKMQRFYLHCVNEHAGEAERDFFGKLFSRHRHLEAVAEVDVHDLATDAAEHKVGRMTIAEAENVTHH